MSFEFAAPGRVTEYDFDGENRLREVRQITRIESVGTTHVWDCQPASAPASFTFEHDKQKRLFVVTWTDGRTERFRDSPTRYLVVAPDPETGEMRPVTRFGQPTYVYPSREEREL